MAAVADTRFPGRTLGVRDSTPSIGTTREDRSDTARTTAGAAGEWTSKDRQSVAERIGGICRKEGYFFVHNHGVPAELLKEVYAEMQRFYRLPPEEKSKYDATEKSQFLGYRGLGREKSRTHAGTEACEQYRIGNTTPDLALPESVDFYHEHFPKSLELFGHLTRLGDGLLAACALDLGLEEDFFSAHLGAPCTASA